MSKPKLKPCPFCGGKAELKLYLKGELLSLRTWALSHYRKDGSFCPATDSRYFANKKYAIKGWNRRVVEVPEKGKGGVSEDKRRGK